MALAILAGWLATGSCDEAAAISPAPSLDAQRAEALLASADAARVAAFATADTAPLRDLFSPAGIGELAPRLERLRQRGERLEERVTSRRLVHWTGGRGRGEGVVEVRGEQRLSLAGAPPRGWSRVVRQWRAEVAFAGGRWLVDSAGDLPPDQWWQGSAPRPGIVTGTA